MPRLHRQEDGRAARDTSLLGVRNRVDSNRLLIDYRKDVAPRSTPPGYLIATSRRRTVLGEGKRSVTAFCSQPVGLTTGILLLDGER